MPRDPRRVFPERLRYYLRENRRAFCAEHGFDETRLSKMLSAEELNPKLDTVNRLAAAIGVDPVDLLTDTPQPQPHLVDIPDRRDEYVAVPLLASPVAAGEALEQLDTFSDDAKADRRHRSVPVASRALVGYYTGARPEAVDRMEWQQLDLTRGTWRYSSKGHRGIVCPLEPVLLEHLRRLHEAAGRPMSGPVWLAPRSGRRVIDWRKPWRRLVAVANHRLGPAETIPPATPLHHLRHSRISHLLGAGVPAQVVAQVTGTSLAMLQRHYAHLMVASLAGELARARQHPLLAAVEAFAHGQTAATESASKAARTAPRSKVEHHGGEAVN